MEEDSPKKSKRYIASWPMLIILLLVIAIIIFLIWFFTRGNVTTTGSNPEIESVDSIVCDITDSKYPFFTYDNSTKKATKVTTTFRNNKLDTVSLIHTLYYPNIEESGKSETLNHAALNINTQNAGLGPDIFNAHYTTTSDSMQLLLSAKTKEISSDTAKYLLLDETNGGNYTKSVVLKNYKNKGFSCEEVNK